MKPLVLGLLLWLGLTVSLVGPAQAPAAESTPAETASGQAVIGPDGMQHVGIVGGSYYFRPNRITVRVNVPVVLTMRMEPGIVPHSLVIEAAEAGIAVDVTLDSTPKTVRFTPTATGLYPIYCKNRLLFFESHREKGMEAMLEVIEQP